MTKIYYDKDANLEVIKEKVIAIVGYGNQGRAQALNMRDSGIKKIIVGSRSDDSLKIAEKDGFPVFPIEDAAKKADILFLLIPDEVAPQIYEEQIAPNLKKGCAVNFSSGYNISFKHIQPSSDVDVIMVGPRMIGEGVRELFQSGEGFPSFIAVEQDSSGSAWPIALAIAKAIGSTKKGAIQVSFNDETYLDLMTEQATLPLIYAVFTEAYSYLVEMGHPEEAVLMELYLSKEPAVLLEKAAEFGLFKQFKFHSNTGQYGQLTRYETVDKKHIREFMATQYKMIKSGSFSLEWEKEQKSGLSNFRKFQNASYENEISKAEERVKEKLK